MDTNTEKTEGARFLDSLPEKQRHSLLQMYIDGVNDMTPYEIAMVLIDGQTEESLRDELEMILVDEDEHR